ncbi:MAG: hypothetical protein ABIG44_00430 [Planctomycetota bacterium]
MPLKIETEQLLRTLERQWEHNDEFLRYLQLTRAICSEVAELRETVKNFLVRMEGQRGTRSGRGA